MQRNDSEVEECCTNSTVMKGSFAMALPAFIVTKDGGMVLNQAVSQMVSIFSRIY